MMGVIASTNASGVPEYEKRPAETQGVFIFNYMLPNASVVVGWSEPELGDSRRDSEHVFELSREFADGFPRRSEPPPAGQGEIPGRWLAVSGVLGWGVALEGWVLAVADEALRYQNDLAGPFEFLSPARRSLWTLVIQMGKRS